MKLLILCCTALFLFAADTDAKLDALMHYERKSTPISLGYNPFVSQTQLDALMKNQPMASLAQNDALHLVAIINQKAFINGIWYRVNQMVQGYKIVKINEQNVVLKQGTHTKILAFDASKELLHVKDSKK